MDDEIFGRYVELLLATVPDKPGGIDRMKAVAQRAMAELTERVGLLEAREERDRLIAIEKAHFDESKAGALRLRYLTANTRLMNGFLATLKDVQAERLAAEKSEAKAATEPPEAEPDAAEEPIAPAAAEAVPPMPADPIDPTAGPAPEPSAPAIGVRSDASTTPREGPGQ
jgi:hypothetical protein